MRRGNIIFLNGVSSSGKTVLAQELQQILELPYLHFSIDSFFTMLPDRLISGDGQRDLSLVTPRVVSGMHRSIAASASAGNHIIVDHVLQAQEWLEECVTLLVDFPMLFVGVHGRLQELERRERMRDRETGLARHQFGLVHTHGVYDLEVNTSACSPTECAIHIE